MAKDLDRKRARNREYMRERYADPSYREAKCAYMRQRYADNPDRELIHNTLNRANRRLRSYGLL